jgi:predicted transcriptional regulator
MFNSRRSEIEIMGEILNLSIQGARKTEVLYQVNLSYKQLNDYLNFLLEKDFIFEKIVEDPKINSYKLYETTSRGQEFLQNINRTLSFLK